MSCRIASASSPASKSAMAPQREEHHQRGGLARLPICIRGLPPLQHHEVAVVRPQGIQAPNLSEGRIGRLLGWVDLHSLEAIDPRVCEQLKIDTSLLLVEATQSSRSVDVGHGGKRCQRDGAAEISCGFRKPPLIRSRLPAVAPSRCSFRLQLDVGGECSLGLRKLAILNEVQRILQGFVRHILDAHIDGPNGRSRNRAQGQAREHGQDSQDDPPPLLPGRQGLSPPEGAVAEASAGAAAGFGGEASRAPAGQVSQRSRMLNESSAVTSGQARSRQQEEQQTQPRHRN
mmetsp:Transcript_14645/g.51458  ORF Transcript_14645/g.51458 Transcript_14645/m.51458 type:complete len:288 (-) Transcript_14645:40-903(-)